MSIEELISKLSQYPPHYSVQVTVEKEEADDLFSAIVDVKHFPAGKIVDLVLAHEPNAEE